MFRSASTCATPLIALLALACGGASQPLSEPAPAIAIGSGRQLATPVEAAARSSAISPLDLADGDGELLVHLDLRALRSSLLYEAARALLADGPRELERVRDACGIDPLEVVDAVAVSMHDVDRDQPLFVAKLSISTEQAMECVRKAWPEGRELKLGEHAAFAMEDYRRSAVVMAAEDLLFVGSSTDVVRALGRRKAVDCARVNLHAALAAGPDTPLAVIVEPSHDEIARVRARATLQPERFGLSGEVVFRDRRSRSGEEYAERAERQVSEALADIRRVLAPGLPAGDPLLTELDAVVVKRDGAQLSASLTVTSSAATKLALGRALLRFRHRGNTSEARNSVGAISRGAMAAYERELPGASGKALHKLCGSALDVPGYVPRGVTYTPDNSSGHDYETGDGQRGWRCLKFSMTQPHRYQYSYRQGGNYKGPARGGPDPGPDGFEVSAEGDLDGDGKTSLFTRTGTVNRAKSTLEASSQVFVVDEYE